MKFLYFIFLFLFVIQIAFAQERFLTISTGGGVTGTSMVYKTSTNGKVLKGKGLVQITFTEEARLKKNKTKKCFRKAQALLMSTPNFSHPGNVYYSIAIRDKDKEGKIVWGDSEHTPPEKAKKLYAEIIALLSGLDFKTYKQL
jgi:hypothetical protein